MTVEKIPFPCRQTFAGHLGFKRKVSLLWVNIYAIPGRKCVTEGGTLSAVDDIRGNDRKVQLRRHFQKDFKFVNLRFILRCGDIQFDQSIDIFLTGFHANAQVGGLSPGGTDTTGLQTKFIEPAVFGSGFPNQFEASA